MDLAAQSPTAPAEQTWKDWTDLDAEVALWSAAGSNLATFTNAEGLLSGTFEPKALPQAVRWIGWPASLAPRCHTRA